MSIKFIPRDLTNLDDECKRIRRREEEAKNVYLLNKNENRGGKRKDSYLGYFVCIYFLPLT